MSVLDVILLLVFIGYGLSGLRHGLVVGILSVGGFIGGAAVAMLLAPHIVGGWQPGVRRTIITVVGVLAIAWGAQVLGLFVGRQVRSVVTWTPLRAVDSGLGALAALVAVALVTWFLAGAVRDGPVPSLASAVTGSRVVAAIDQVVPPGADSLFSGFREVVATQDFPQVFAGFGHDESPVVAAPDASVVAAAAAAAAGSTVKITGTAESCQRGREGSGFVVAPHRVVTNAHVVAGVTAPSVQVDGQGPSLSATVVVYDPQRDLAVLDVPALKAPTLGQGTDLAANADAVVVGFPEDGSFTSSAARIREVVSARGKDIYGSSTVVREVYSLAAQVLPGNSGGPLLDPEGHVVGIVFARSLDDTSTGYALTLSEAQPVLDAAPAASRPVSTGACTSS